VASNELAEQTPATFFQFMYNALLTKKAFLDFIKLDRIEEDNVSAIKPASRSSRR
jgi:hypothetical protein